MKTYFRNYHHHLNFFEDALDDPEAHNDSSNSSTYNNHVSTHKFPLISQRLIQRQLVRVTWHGVVKQSIRLRKILSIHHCEHIGKFRTLKIHLTQFVRMKYSLYQIAILDIQPATKTDKETNTIGNTLLKSKCEQIG